MPTDEKYKKKSSKNKFWNHSYLIIAMVREIAVMWNQIEVGVEQMYAKLVKIGTSFVD